MKLPAGLWHASDSVRPSLSGFNCASPDVVGIAENAYRRFEGHNQGVGAVKRGVDDNLAATFRALRSQDLQASLLHGFMRSANSSERILSVNIAK